MRACSFCKGGIYHDTAACLGEERGPEASHAHGSCPWCCPKCFKKGKAALEKIRGTGAAQHIGDLLLELNALFSRVVEPVLGAMCREGTAAHFTLRDETLETTFRFAQARNHCA